MPKFDFRSPRLFVDAALAVGQTVALERSQSNYLGNVLADATGIRFTAVPFKPDRLWPHLHEKFG